MLATPALRRLRQQQPHAQIVALVGPWSASILARNQDIDALLTLPFPGFERSGPRRARLWPYLLLLRTALLVRAGRFDLALLLRDDHWWGAALALLAGVPCRIGFGVPECRPLLSHALPWHPAQHVSQQALDLVGRAGTLAPAAAPDPAHPAHPAPDAERLRYPLSFAPAPAESAWAADWLATQGVAPDARLIVVHPGTGGVSKLWLAERWAEVAAALVADQPGRRLLLTGGPGEDALVARVAEPLSSLQPPLLRLVGTASIGQLAALLGRAALVLGVDSGPLHLAVSQGVPTLHLFGPGDAGRFGPWGDPQRHIVLRARLWCSPCGIFAACPRRTDPPECMAQLATAQVLAAAEALLAAAPPTPAAGPAAGRAHSPE